LRSKGFPRAGEKETGGVDISASNAGARLAGSKAAPPASLRPMRSVHRGEYFMESSGHGKAKPVITIALDRGCLVYGVNSSLCQVLSDGDCAAILETVGSILRAGGC
jgi:hypothetical protein